MPPRPLPEDGYVLGSSRVRRSVDGGIDGGIDDAGEAGGFRSGDVNAPCIDG
ncbi:MAG TPA: hypothetical protein VG325_17160 [Solirubrobacteraceae bacterium]|nr:hypothetical protein [Solirubrobacteraceae bacterium]